MKHNSDNAPCDAKQNEDDIKKEGAIDAKVLPLDSSEVMGPTDLDEKQ